MAAVEGHLAPLIYLCPRLNEWQLCGSGVFFFSWRMMANNICHEKACAGNSSEKREGDMFGVAMTL